MSENFIPVCEPLLTGNEKKYVLDALETGWISSSGKYIAAFEEAFAAYVGVKHAVAVCNGTVALHLGLVALGVSEGDEVIVPDFTMIASAFAVCYTGAAPVPVDAERVTWNIDARLIEQKITARTKAIMPVHIYGHPCDMDTITTIARTHGLKVIEDAAEVHGAMFKGRRCGSMSDVAAFSFFANKIATTGEGGMVVTNDGAIAERCRYYKNLCFPLKGARSYLHDHIGFNYRMSNLHAAIGLAQVERLDEYVTRRRTNHALYARHLAGVPGIHLQPEMPGCLNVYWMNGITVDGEQYGMSRDALAAALKNAGIDTRLFFQGMHRQPSLQAFGCQCEGSYPVSDWLAESGLYLPSGSGLGEHEISRIAGTVRRLASPGISSK
jgi:perosamine synthetase